MLGNLNNILILNQIIQLDFIFLDYLSYSYVSFASNREEIK